MPTLNRDIQQLNLASNNITTLGRNEFYRKKFRNLQKINLSANQLLQIDRRAFYKLTGLVELDLSENLISSFDYYQVFDSISENEEPSAAHRDRAAAEVGDREPFERRLASIGGSRQAGADDDSSQNGSTFLQDLTQLRVLNLASNQLITLERFTFSSLAQLRQLYLSR